MSRVPSVQTAASAALPTTTDGATPMKMSTSYRPVTLSLNGEVSDPTPKIIANLALNDLLGEGSQLQASSMLRDYEKERYLAAVYTKTLGTQGTLLHTGVTDYRDGEMQSGYLDGIYELTVQTRFDLGLTTPWVPSIGTRLILDSGLYAVSYADTYQKVESGDEVKENQQVRALYTQLSLNQNTSKTSINASLMLAQGMETAGASQDRSNNYGEAMTPGAAHLDFFRVPFDFGLRRRAILGGLGAAISMGGQYASDAVPVSERVSFGGTRYGRAYQPGEVAGDEGLGGGVEINYSFSTPWRWLQQWEPYVLYETAETKNYDKELPEMTIHSSSLGMRFTDGRYYNLDIAASRPTGDAPEWDPKRQIRWSLLFNYRLDV